MPPAGLANNIKALTRRYNALQKQVQELVQEREQRQFEQALLVGLYDCWALLNERGESACGEPCLDEDFLLLQCELLQSLATAAAADPPASVAVSQQQQGSNSAGSTASQSSGEAAEDERIAPRSQPLSYLEYLITAPLLEEVKTMTAQELAAGYKDTVLRASLLLHRLDNERGVARQETIKELASCWDRHYRLLMSAVLAGRPELVAAFTVYDLSTLQPEPQGVLAKNANHIATVPALLKLSHLQMRDIASGLVVFKRLLQQVKEQQQQAHTDSTSSSSRAGDAAHDVATFEGVMHSIEATGKSTGRMAVALRKEYTVRASAAAYFVGCATWQQISRAAVLCWPHASHIMALAHSIADFYEQQQRQQPQPQQQAAEG